MNISKEELITLIDQVAIKQLSKYKNEEFYNSIPKQVVHSLAASGLLSLNISQSYGGLELDSELYYTALERLAYHDSGIAIFTSVHLMVAGILQEVASDKAKEYLPLLANGQMLAAFALTEPHAGSDAKSIKSELKNINKKLILSGQKCYITSAGFAQLYLVFAQSESGISAILLPADSKNLRISKPEHKMGAELSPIASLYFDDIPIEPSQLLGEAGKGFEIAKNALLSGRIAIAAIANGISKKAIELSTKFLKERKQFGKSISEFQGLQFILADMEILYQAASSLVDKAILHKSDAKQVAITKCFATDAAMKITTDAVQLHGGAGYIKEYHIESLMRAAKMLQIVEGTNQIQRSIIAKNILRGAN